MIMIATRVLTKLTVLVVFIRGLPVHAYEAAPLPTGPGALTKKYAWKYTLSLQQYTFHYTYLVCVLFTYLCVYLSPIHIGT